MNNFLIIPTVVDGKGRVFVQQTEHNGRTRSIYQEEMSLKTLRYIERQFRKAADELEYQTDIDAARELNDEIKDWRRAAND